MITKLIKVSVIIVLSIITLSIADDSNEAQVFLDFNAKTQEVEPTPSGINEGEELCVAIIGENLKGLYSYSFKMQFDEEIVNFESAVKSLNGETAFLESNGGKILAFMVKPKEGEVEVATTLKGVNPDTPVSGKGVMGVITFSGKAFGDPMIKVVEIKMVDINGKGTVLNFEDKASE